MNGSSFWRGRRVLVTGGSGFVGRNLVPLLRETGCELFAPSHAEFELLEQAQVRRMFAEVRPELVVHLAALSAGILANKQFPASFCYQNLLMNTLVMQEAHVAGVRKYVTLMGGCSYPAHAPSPIRETELWHGYPQPESAPYSLAKAMNVVMADSYRRQYGFDAIVLVPGNLYGPYDNFDLGNSHVIPATIRKFWEARERGDAEVVAWGTGKPIRDFVYVDDVCRAIVLATETYSSSDIINISSGVPVTIRELVETVAELTGFRGQVRWDTSKPEGQMEKGFDVTRLRERLGYTCPTSLRDGLARTIGWFSSRPASVRLDVPVEPAGVVAPRLAG